MVNIESLKNLKYQRFYKKLSIICSKCKNEDEKILKKKESVQIIKILGLIQNI